MTDLRIAPGLRLPIDIVTQAIAILARKGAGKTYTASVLVEEVVKARVPVVVLDPTGAWWGLRTSADGERPGLQVTIFGGDHGDVPLDPSVGAEIADVILEHPRAYVVDLSAFPSKATEQRFAADFLERLYRGKRPETGPLLLVVDEADVFAPQQPRDKGDQLRTLGALESIVRRGRIKGLGGVLITQRAAVLNKNVLEQTEVLVVMQTTGPRDRAAIDSWIEGHGTREERETVLGSLASLERGEAWVWSPSFLRVLQRVRIRARQTFDSSRTPAAGETAATPRAFAAVDIEQLGERIQAAREKAKAEDPRELRRRIAELERRAAVQPAVQTVERVVEVPVLNGQVDKLADVISRLTTTAMAIGDLGRDIGGIATEIVSALGRVAAAPQPAQQLARAATTPRGDAGRPGEPHVEAAPRTRGAGPATTTDLAQQAGVGAPNLGKAHLAILGALASYPLELTREQLAFLAGYHPRTPGFANALGALRSAGLVTPAFPAALTDEGRRVAPVVAIPDDVVATWMTRFGKAERAILTILLRERPNAVAREDLAAEAGYHPRTPGFANALGKLRGLGLVEGFAISAGFDALIEASR